MQEGHKYILVLGGNGFIGAECVETLLNTFDKNKYKLVLINRGNWNDWDSSTRIKPHIHENIVFDRSHGRSLETVLGSYLNRDGFKFEAVVDFSGFKRNQMKSVCEGIPLNKIGLYIYISTDSVYEVSVTRSDKNAELLETDSVRPQSKDDIRRLKKLDSYAHHKLK